MSKRNNKTSKRKRKKRREPEYHGIIGFIRNFLRHLRLYMTAGLLIWVPFFVTASASWWVLSNIGFGINRLLEGLTERVNVLVDRVPRFGEMFEIEYSPFIGFLLTILLFLTTGFLARYLVGRKVIATGERLVAKIPIISRVYVAAQQIRDVFVNRKGTVFQEVVLLEYPRPGLIVVGFVTSREPGVVQKARKESLAAIFVPTTPNPTSGFLIYAKPDQLTTLDISIEDAMKLIVSGGAYLPGSASFSKNMLESPPEP